MYEIYNIFVSRGGKLCSNDVSGKQETNKRTQMHKCMKYITCVCLRVGNYMLMMEMARYKQTNTHTQTHKCMKYNIGMSQGGQLCSDDGNGK
jgi:hypothetical protein